MYNFLGLHNDVSPEKRTTVPDTPKLMLTLFEWCVLYVPYGWSETVFLFWPTYWLGHLDKQLICFITSIPKKKCWSLQTNSLAWNSSSLPLWEVWNVTETECAPQGHCFAKMRFQTVKLFWPIHHDVGQVTPKNSCFYDKEKVFLAKSIPKTFYLILQTKSPV